MEQEHLEVGTTAHPQRKRSTIIHDQSEMHELDSLMNVMENQNQITETLRKQQGQFTLPSVTIPVFKGDPLDYLFFMSAFEYGIERKTEKSQDRLFLLEQYTLRHPRELACRCQNMHPERGYAAAKELLKKHFGDEHKILPHKGLNWAIIKVEDAEALQAYSVFLNGCLNTMNSVQYLEELNHPVNMKAIPCKLYFKLQEKLQIKAFKLQDCNGPRAKFADLVEFVSHQSRILSRSLFGNLNPAQARRAGSSQASKPISSKRREAQRWIH